MIKNFENITYELTPKELELVELVMNGFNGYRKDSPIKAPEICAGMNKYLSENNIKMKFTSVRLRKFVNYIRANSLLPLIATSKGYYVTDSQDEIDSCVESLKNRANGILEAAKGLEKLNTT
jgi:hypothetical protein